MRRFSLLCSLSLSLGIALPIAGCFEDTGALPASGDTDEPGTASADGDTTHGVDGDTDATQTGSPSPGIDETDAAATGSATAGLGSTTGDASLCPSGTEVVHDGGFEATVFGRNDFWRFEGPEGVSPFCNEACAEDVQGDGNWWLALRTRPQASTWWVEQAVELPAAVTHLQLYFRIFQDGAFLVDQTPDTFTVWLDDEVVFEAASTDVTQYFEWQMISIPLEGHADGAAHTLAFSADMRPSNLGRVQFLVDRASVTCP